MKTAYLRGEDFLVQVLDKGTSFYTFPPSSSITNLRFRRHPLSEISKNCLLTRNFFSCMLF
jgi:hypothetical protein